MTCPVVPVCLGSQVPDGKPIESDLYYSGNLLVTGSTGAGKSVAVRKMISAIATSISPSAVRFILIDPKMGVEFGLFDDLPHLLFPVIDDHSKVPAVLRYLSGELDRRYRLLRQADCRDLLEYRKNGKDIPVLILVVEELADLLMTQPRCADAIVQLAQKGRAAGLVMVLVTQRPSADILPGLLMANILSRACFRVANQVNSRLVLDQGGAEQLKKPGEFLYRSPTQSDVLHGRTELSDTEAIRLAVGQAQKRFGALAVDRLPMPQSSRLTRGSSRLRVLSRFRPAVHIALVVISRMIRLLVRFVEAMATVLEWIFAEMALWFRKRARRADSRSRPRQRGRHRRLW